MSRALLAFALVGCAVVDTLDGHIDNQQNCCAAFSASRIRACMVRFSGPELCSIAECVSPIGTVEAYQTVDGELLTSCPTSGAVP